MKSYRVIHFVSGGGAGSTKVAMALAFGHKETNKFEPILIFRRKKKRDPSLINEIRTQGIPFAEVANKPKFLTIYQLVKLIKKYNPQILVAHGYSEHIWGRIAAILAKVPIIIQVEHNTEKYKPQHFWESRLLSKYTHKIICVSYGVKEYLVSLGFSPKNLQVIYNGIQVQNYFSNQELPLLKRQLNIIMIARFARQKDHTTLIKATHQLLEYPLNVLLVGGGKNAYRKKCEELVQKLGLQDKILFLGKRTEIPELLAQNQIFVLSTHYEGFGLVVVEAMIAGCIVIGSNVAGVSELIKDGETGFLVPPNDPITLAEKIKFIVNNPDLSAKIAKAGQEYAMENFNLERMIHEYEELFLSELKQQNL